MYSEVIKAQCRKIKSDGDSRREWNCLKPNFTRKLNYIPKENLEIEKKV